MTAKNHGKGGVAGMAPAAPVFAGMPAPTGTAPNLENNAVSVGAALCRERAA